MLSQVRLLCSSCVGLEKYGPRYSTGDIIRCDVNLSSDQPQHSGTITFWKKQDRDLSTRWKPEDCLGVVYDNLHGTLTPVVSMWKEGDSVELISFS